MRAVCWHYTSPRTISHAVAHPTENAFVVALCSPLSSTVLLFHISSSRPHATQDVPFGFASLQRYQLAESVRPFRKRGFALVGITTVRSIVLIGDSVPAYYSEDQQHRVLGKSSGAQRGPTMFQDMFGSSALAFSEPPLDTAPRTAGSTSTMPAQTTTRDSLDTPAYRLPHMETLFESLLTEFLKEKKDDVSQLPASRPPPAATISSNYLDAAINTTISARTQDLDVNTTQVEALAQLFSTHASKVNGLHFRVNTPLTLSYSTLLTKPGTLPNHQMGPLTLLHTRLYAISGVQLKHRLRPSLQNLVLSFKYQWKLHRQTSHYRTAIRKARSAKRCRHNATCLLTFAAVPSRKTSPAFSPPFIMPRTCLHFLRT